MENQTKGYKIMNDKPKITNETKITTQVIMFGDGANGYFIQSYRLYVDDQEIGVIMKVEGHQGKDDTKRWFEVLGMPETFDNIKDAFVAAGWEWERDN